MANARKRDGRGRAVRSDDARTIVLTIGREVYNLKAASQENICEHAWTMNLEISNAAIKCKINSEVEMTDF